MRPYQIRRDRFECLGCGGTSVRHVLVVRAGMSHETVVMPASKGRAEACPRCGKAFPTFRLRTAKMVEPGGLVVWGDVRETGRGSIMRAKGMR